VTDERYLQYIGGRWVSSHSGDRIDVVDPTTERVLATVPRGDRRDVDDAVGAARRAFPAWAATPPHERAALLTAVADGLEGRAGEVAATITAELGCPITLSRSRQVAGAVFHFRAAAEQLLRFAAENDGEQLGNSLVVREPYGVVGAITPWNYPLIQIAAKIAYALAAGNTVVLKPSEVAPICVYVLAGVFDDTGLPAGAFNMVSGAGDVVGEALAAHPDVDVISFTGSTAVGRLITRAASATVKRVALELGGKSPTVVAPGADLERAVTTSITSLAKNSGQTCAAQTRLIVEGSALDRVEEIIARATRTIRVGDPRDPETAMGPVASKGQYERVRGYIAAGIRDGAKLVVGGLETPDGADGGYFVAPTVFSGVTETMSVRNEEIFGPVLVIETYDTIDEAIALANGTVYGLSAGVWAGDRQGALEIARQIRAGQVQVNGGAFNDLAPFGGYKQSGNGREFGARGFDEFLETKSFQL
jgi:acyl-CoA reductase-like NAD-dependent aldehyde dehydrogenase